MDDLLLSTAPLEHSSMDYVLLRQESIKHIQRLVGRSWTDYNSHDPGVTILEQLCYAITDLAYRTNYTIPDLLAESGSDCYENFFNAAEILTSHPVTLLDWRKLIIDVPGVKNAWVEKVDDKDLPLFFHKENRELLHQPYENTRMSEPVALKGLYRVFIEKTATDRYESGAVIQEVRRRLHEHRNLCEDFVPVTMLDHQDIQIFARIEINDSGNAEQLLLRIYQRIAEHFSPEIRRYTLAELLADGKAVDDIFNGPRLKNGFIDTQELIRSPHRTELRLSDIIHEIMQAEGVRVIKQIHLATDPKARLERAPDNAPISWLIKLDKNKIPTLHIDYSNFILEKNGLEVSLDYQRVKTLYENQPAESKAVRPDSGKMTPPPGRDRKTERYYSIQHQFPDAYGVNSNGLSTNATPQQRASARQLKAYLMFFDQLLANQFAQLGNVRTLFSFDGDSPNSYFSQSISDPSLGLDFREDVNTFTTDVRKGGASFHSKELQRITELPETEAKAVQENSINPERRNRFLNHLLARFAEQLTDYSLLLNGITDQAYLEAKNKLIRSKREFLKHYPRISSTRGTAFNYLEPLGISNRSGLEQRVRHKLGIEETFYLVEHILLRPIKQDLVQQAPLLGDMKQKDPYSLQLSFVLSKAKQFKSEQLQQFAARTIREETPAHLAVYIHWLDEKDMKAFEQAYVDWLEKRRQFDQ